MKLTYDTYPRYEELTLTLRALADEHPGLCKVESIGKSYEGREIWLMELTNTGTGPAAEKPAFWVDGNTHAGEVTGSMAALYLLETLLEGYGSDERITDLLDRQAFYLLPRLSPDGAERYLTTPYSLRASMRPWPEPEEEGLEDEVHRPEPTAQVSQGGVRETDPIRPLPRLDRAAPGSPAPSRGALSRHPEGRADRREHRIPANERDQGRCRQEAHKAR
jgi:hypothetical protein